MNIKQAKEEIKNCIEAYLLTDEHGDYVIPSVNQRPLLVTGPPGIGKTQMMEQVAAECGVGFVPYTITHQTEESVVSQPYLEKRRYDGREYVVTEYTMSKIVAAVYEYMELTGVKEGILFIDEFNALPDALQPAMRQFLQCKTFGNDRLPDGWVIIMAGSMAEYIDTVPVMGMGMLDRIINLRVKADFDAWKDYAFENALHPAVISYLDANRDNLFCVEFGDTGQMFATPRGWEDLARILEINEKLGKKVDSKTISQYIGHSGIVKNFAEFLPLFSIYKSEYRIDRVLAGDTYDDLAIRISNAFPVEKASVVNIVLDKLNTKFREVNTRELYLGLLLEQLKKIKDAARMHIASQESGKIPDDGGVPEYLGFLRAEIVSDLDRRRRQDLISREEEKAGRAVAERLKAYNRNLIETRCTAWSLGFKQVCHLFEKESGDYERLCENILSMMECAFDFFEASFGGGPEVVKFVTELNNNYYSNKFLTDNKCDRYYEYNKRLTFESKEDSLRNRLAKL